MNDPMDVEMADAEITVTPPLTSHRTALQEIGQCNIFNHKCTRLGSSCSHPSQDSPLTAGSYLCRGTRKV